MGKVTVTGTREKGYRPTVETTANKTGSETQKTPFSVQVVSRELIRDRGVTSIAEAVRTVPGLTPQVGYGGSNARFRLRGFAVPFTLKDGFRRSGFIPADDLANVEQIEALKGPASALYGAFEPGGVINIVSKKPLQESRNEGGVAVGSYGFRRVSVDTTGALGARAAYRLNAAWQDADSFRSHVWARSAFVAPVVSWRVGGQGTVLVSAELLRRRGAFDRGFGNNKVFLDVPIATSYAGGPTRSDTDSDMLSVVYNTAVDDWADLHIGAMHSRGKLHAQWWSYGFPPVFGAANPATARVNRQFYDSTDTETDTTAQVELSGTRGATVRHRWLLGFELNRSARDADYYNAPTQSTPLLAPRYGVPTGVVTRDGGSVMTQGGGALYVQDQIEFGPHWTLLLGARHDRVRMSIAGSWYELDVPFAQTVSATSPRVGLTWSPSRAFSLYGSWARSFQVEPDAGRLRGGDLPRPTHGEQVEVGAKLNLLDGRLTPTLSRFDVRRLNGVVSDPEDPMHVIQVGEQRARGWEVDVPMALSARWRLIASYTRLDARFDRDPELANKIIANAPRDNASLWSTFDFQGALRGVSLGLGGNYVGQRQANNSNTFQLPCYVRWDANLAYVFGRRQGWRAQLNVENLGNRRYYDSGGSFVPTYPGAPRTVTASVSHRF